MILTIPPRLLVLVDIASQARYRYQPSSQPSYQPFSQPCYSSPYLQEFGSGIPRSILRVLTLESFQRSVFLLYSEVSPPRSLTAFRNRTPLPGRGHYAWFHSFRTLDDKFILRNNSLDAYCFLRFLKTIILLCFVGSCITWPILFPVNATGGGDASQLDRISISN